MNLRPPIQALVEQALRQSRSDGCIVIGTEGDQANLRFAGNRLTTNGQTHDRELTVISVVDGVAGVAGTRAGVVSRPIAEVDDVTALVRESEAAALAASPADDAAPLVAPYEVDDRWEDPVASSGIEAFAGFASELAGACRRAQNDDRVLYGFASVGVTSTFVGTSTGLRRRFDQPEGGVDINVKSADGRRSVWAGRTSNDFADFADVDLAGLESDLMQRYGWTSRRVDLPAGRYDTVLPPSAVADLMIYAYWTMSARDAEEGRTVFAAPGGGTRLGEQLSPLPLTLRSDPAAAGLRCAPFEVATSSSSGLTSVFDNGAPALPTSWIDRGRLAELARTRAWAERTGQPFRPLLGNLVLDGNGVGGELDLVAGMERGLLLTCLWYIREVDPQTLLLTGLTRDGVFLVEDGAVTGAVNNFRFNESPVGLLGRVTGVGATVPTFPREWGDYFSRAAMPPLRVNGFNMSTVSDAT